MSVTSKPMPPMKPKITPAQVRVVKKANRPGGVKMAGAFGKPLPGAHEHNEFYRKAVIERCVKAGWLFYGDAFGTYEATIAGCQAVHAYGDWLDAKDAYRSALRLWRHQQKKPRKSKPVSQENRRAA